MKRTQRSWNSTLRRVSDKQKVELQRRKDLKEFLIWKYGERCMTCGSNGDWRGLSLSHKIALSQGGKTMEENCLIECIPCHDKFEKKNYLREQQQ